MIVSLSIDRQNQAMPAAFPTQRVNAWEANFPARMDAALRVAQSVGDAQLIAGDLRTLVDAIVNDTAAALVEPLYDEFRIETRNQARHQDAPFTSDVGPITVEFVLPCRGAADVLLSTEPRAVDSARSVGGPAGTYDVLMTLSLNASEGQDVDSFAEGIADLRGQWFARIAEATEEANVRIRGHRDEVRAAVEDIVRLRKGRATVLSNATKLLNIPLNPSADSQISIPLTPAALNLSVVEAAANAGDNEAGLAAEIADAVVQQITSFGRALERLPRTANRLAAQDEESIRDILLFILNANWQGAATGETFIGYGKSDLLLRWRDRDAFIGECKFWHGEKHFRGAIDQLLGRYTVWRATRVALVVFIRETKDITSAIDRAQATILSHERFVGPSERTQGFAALMKAQHDSQQIVTLNLIPVVIPGFKPADPA